MKQPNDNTQAKMVFDYIIDFGSISPMEAMIDLGIMCLAERVRDLRNMGIDIKTTTERRKNRYGKMTAYSRYSL